MAIHTKMLVVVLPLPHLMVTMVLEEEEVTYPLRIQMGCLAVTRYDQLHLYLHNQYNNL